jgi:hypothetical protein
VFREAKLIEKDEQLWLKYIRDNLEPSIGNMGEDEQNAIVTNLLYERKRMEDSKETKMFYSQLMKLLI